MIADKKPIQWVWRTAFNAYASEEDLLALRPGGVIRVMRDEDFQWLEPEELGCVAGWISEE